MQRSSRFVEGKESNPVVLKKNKKVSILEKVKLYAFDIKESYNK